MRGSRACVDGERSRTHRLGGVGRQEVLHSCAVDQNAWGHKEEGGTCVEVVGSENAFVPGLPR